MPLEGFVAALGEVFEHAPWVAQAAAAGRPYATVAALHDAMIGAVRREPPTGNSPSSAAIRSSAAGSPAPSSPTPRSPSRAASASTG